MLDSISNIFTNSANSTLNCSKQIGHGILRFLPYLIGATICLGLREQTMLASQETLIFTNRKILEGATAIISALALKSLWDASESYNSTVNSRKIEMVTIPKEEYEALKAEIDRLKQGIKKT
jgi:cell division protein FtsB